MPEVLYIEQYAEIIDRINKGSVCIIPTDTVYGLACDANNSAGLDKIYELKKRSAHKKIAIFLSNTSQIEDYGYTTKLSRDLANAFMPGPLTILLQRKTHHVKNESIRPLLYDDRLISTDSQIAIRIPKHQHIINIINRLGKPIAVTSCNISGQPEAMAAHDIDREIYNNVDMLIEKYDGDKRANSNASNTSKMNPNCPDPVSENLLTSTIVDASDESGYRQPIKILREGVITRKMIDKVLAEINGS